MQRMIRQFAAEYTSKNISTQDSSPPNSTKNQSLPKSPSGQSSPPPATTQNPVLSKLLMADQDSPLDLTVKKPHSEEPCEQADGVLDLSTKKSPCSGSPNSSISPSTSNTIGNGTQDTEKKEMDPNKSGLTLELFMSKLCSQHQKQFIRVLNNLCTEESILKSKSQSAPVSEVVNANIEGYDHSYSDRKVYSPMEVSKSASESSSNCQVTINTNTDLHEDKYHDGNPQPPDYKTDHSIHLCHATDQTMTDNPVANSKTEGKTATVFSKISEVNQTVYSEHGVLSRSNSAINMLNDSPGSELPTDIPKIANKENTQYINPKPTFLDCNDCKLKQENSVTTVTVKKLANFHESPFQHLADYSGSTLHKIRALENKRLKTVKCRDTQLLMTNDCDKQCDVVYISEPITTQCHFETHKPVVCPRQTARKSTRGYLYGSECCELSTVRTLVRSSKVEDRGNPALDISEALIIPNDLIETLPSTDAVSLFNVEEKRVENYYFNSTPQNDDFGECIPDSSSSNESKNRLDEHLGLAAVPVDVSDSLITMLSQEAQIACVENNHDELALDEIPKTKINSIVNIDAIHEKTVEELVVEPNGQVSHSDNSCGQEESSDATALDLEINVSLKNNQVLSNHDKTPQCSPSRTEIQQDFAIAPNSHAIAFSAKSLSLPNGISNTDFPNIGFSKLNDSKIVSEVSLEIIDSPAVISTQKSLIQMSSENYSDVKPKENLEHPINPISQCDINSSNSLDKLQEHSVQNGVEDEVDSIGLKILPTLRDGQSLARDVSDEMETKDHALKPMDDPQPLLDELTCPTSDGLRPAEHLHNLLDICAKNVGNVNVRLEENVSKDHLHHDTVSSSVCNSDDTFDEPLKTELTDGDSNITAVTPDNSLSFNEHKPITPLKRHKKVPAPTDRCLRSRELSVDPPLQTISSLQVLLSFTKGSNSAKRSVQFKTENTPCSSSINYPIEDCCDGENYFAASLNRHCGEGEPLLWKSMLKSTFSSPFKFENIKIYFNIHSDERMVSFVKQSPQKSPNMVDTRCKLGATNLRKACPLQLQTSGKRLSDNDSNFSSQTKSNTKNVALKTSMDSMKNFKCCKLKNLSAGINQINNGANNQNRPKFIDWCTEEENHERISYFNDMYTTIHQNWIPLDKEAANMAKSKNKADKLKEIWKTKKRVRRPKSIQDGPRSSPMQMLFTNSSKFSDICRWFMETTETKSLVIVKNSNTRIPEEHQLPIIPSPKYSSQSLYPHTLQAQRLKKHLKKFASVFPARNDIALQSSLNELVNAPLNQVTKDTVKEPNDCKMPETNVKKIAPIHILQKYNKLRENLICTVNKNKKQCVINNAKKKAGHTENMKETSTKQLSLQKVPNSFTSKSLKIKNDNSKKRSRNDSLMESVAQPNKKRKTAAKQPPTNKNAGSTRMKLGKLSKMDSTSNLQAPKKKVENKTNLRKGKAITPMQKKNLKSQHVLKCQTRSTKKEPQHLSDLPKITRFSSSHRKKELHKAACTVSSKSKVNVGSQLRQRKPRSQLEPTTTRKGRSLEYK
ncbi:ligand-dependent corepressor isoform X2 [Engystomops pustulosus]